ncbi:Site-specific recombinase XerD [Fibrobacter sp. UWOV1]|nr:Site-specific recombinase XerD [Fibrobacter sp. UWOV1]
MKKFSVVQRHKSRGIKTWYGRIYDKDSGRPPQYVSLGVDKKKDALAWRDRMVADQLNGNVGKGDSVLVSNAIESFFRTNDMSDLTERNYRSAFIVLEEWFREKGINVLGDITNIVASDFVSSLDSWKASTKRKRVTIYRSWAKWCMEMYEPRWKKNPFVAVKVKGEKSKPRDFWTIEQVEAILAAEENPLLRLMYAFMAFAGLRFAEAASLTYADVFEDDGNVKRKLRILGKGGKVAFVPICTRLKEQISSTFQNPQIYPKHPNFSQFLGTAKSLKIFPQYQYNCSQNRSLKALFRRNSILASFGGEVHLHRFRHSFISNLIRANCCSIRCVADLARHENVNITLNTYSHLLPSDKEEALEIFTRKDTQDKQGGS